MVLLAPVAVLCAFDDEGAAGFGRLDPRFCVHACTDKSPYCGLRLHAYCALGLSWAGCGHVKGGGALKCLWLRKFLTP